MQQPYSWMAPDVLIVDGALSGGGWVARHKLSDCQTGQQVVWIHSTQCHKPQKNQQPLQEYLKWEDTENLEEDRDVGMWGVVVLGLGFCHQVFVPI